MRKAKVYNHGILAGILIENEDQAYRFEYDPTYEGAPISLTLPTNQKVYTFKNFPPFFDGLLPEGVMLESLLKSAKLDRSDYLGQLIHVGKDLVGSVSVEAE